MNRRFEWKLSPAYDLTPAVPVSTVHRDLAMECGDAGRFANAENLLSQCRRFLLEEEQASRLVDDMEAQVRATWFATARECGVTVADCDKIAGAFAYEGFRLRVDTGDGRRTTGALWGRPS